MTKKRLSLKVYSVDGAIKLTCDIKGDFPTSPALEEEMEKELSKLLDKAKALYVRKEMIYCEGLRYMPKAKHH